MENTVVKILDDNGNLVEHNILFTFECEELGKSYIAYTDNTYDEEGNIQVYASTYDPNSEEMILGEIKTDKEWKVIETILDTIQQELREKQESSEQ